MLKEINGCNYNPLSKMAWNYWNWFGSLCTFFKLKEVLWKDNFSDKLWFYQHLLPCFHPLISNSYTVVSGMVVFD